MTYNKFIDIVHLYFVEILFPQFLVDSFINTLLFNVGHLQFRFGLSMTVSGIIVCVFLLVKVASVSFVMAG